MAYRFETDSNFFRVTDTSTSEILINEVRSGLKWGYTVDLTYAIYFKEAITNSTEDEIFKVSDYSFAFADIVDADDIAFTTEAIFRQWLSQRLGFIGDEAIITQFIRDGYTETVPSEDAVYDALELKLDITALPSNLTLYPTSTVSDIATYYKMATSVTDPDYDSPAVDFATPAISGVGELVGSLATTAGILTGNPGIMPNVTTIGNIKRDSGTGTVEFYFEVYHRDSVGAETLIGTSSATPVVSNATYEQFDASCVWDNGDFDPTDRIVIKYYANRIAGGSDPVYSFQFGGATPVRTVVPVPASVLLDVPIQIGVTEVVDGTSGRVLTVNGTVVGEKVIDTTPTNGSANLIDSNAVYDGLAGKSNRYENNRLLLIGDSITAQGYTTSPSARYRNLGWWCWALSYMNWNLKVSHVGAVSGYTTAQVLADLETQLQTYSPQWTWGITGQNDLGLDDVVGVLVDIDSIVALCKQYGTKLMLGTVTPRTVMTAQMQEDIAGINKGLRNLALVGDIILFDSEACILDSTSTTGLASASYLYDTIHPNPTGSWRIGLEAYNKIKYFIPESTQSGGVSSGDDISINAFSKILNKNCKLVGTSGTVSTGTSGDVSNNFLLARSSGTGLTAVGSKVLESTYKDVNWQRIVVGGTSAGSDELRFQQSIADSTFLTPITEGTDKIKGRVTIRMSGLSTNILNVRLTVNTIAASAETGATQCMVDNGFNLATSPTETMTFETPELTVPVGTDTVRISVFIKYAIGAATGTIDLTDMILTVV